MFFKVLCVYECVWVCLSYSGHLSVGRTLLRTLTTGPDQLAVYVYPDQAWMCRYQQHSLTELHQKYIHIFRILFCLVLCSYLVILDFRNKGIYLLCMCMRGACQESEWSVGYYIYPLYLVYKKNLIRSFFIVYLAQIYYVVFSGLTICC